jgi:hypothetical protein
VIARKAFGGVVLEFGALLAGRGVEARKPRDVLELSVGLWAVGDEN